MAYRVVIVGISGAERFLRERDETPEEKKALRFRSERAAEDAAKAHIDAFPAVIRKSMAFRVEESR